MENLYTPNSIRTFSGLYFNYLNPTTEMVKIEDIAHALSRIPRFLGHTEHPVPVAVHCLAMAATLHEVGSPYALEALLHDAAEAYLCDIPKPLKTLLPDYQKLEEIVNRVIATKFKLMYPFRKSVRDQDKEMLELEWEINVLGKKPAMMNLTPGEYKDKFLEYYELLKR
jgi:5'-deoxynucleotidase YfbR-like HD superfamily hydrolase